MDWGAAGVIPEKRERSKAVFQYFLKGQFWVTLTDLQIYVKVWNIMSVVHDEHKYDNVSHVTCSVHRTCTQFLDLLLIKSSRKQQKHFCSLHGLNNVLFEQPLLCSPELGSERYACWEHLINTSAERHAVVCVTCQLVRLQQFPLQTIHAPALLWR